MRASDAQESTSTTMPQRRHRQRHRLCRHG